MKADSPGTLPPSRHWRIKLKMSAVWCGSVVAILLSAGIRGWFPWIGLPVGIAMTIWAYMLVFQYHEALERDRKICEAELPPGIEPGDAPGSEPLASMSEPLAALGDAHVAAHSLAIDSDGRLLAVGHDTGTIRLWNIAEPSSPVPLATVVHEGVITTVSLHSGAQILATGSLGGTIALWSITDPYHPAMLSTLDSRTGPLSTVHALALSPNGRSMAAGGRDGTVRIWDVHQPTAPQPVATIRYQKRPSKRWPTGPYSIRYSPNGRLLAVGGYNGGYGVVELWSVADPANATRVASLRPHSAGAATSHTTAAHAVDFSPDGRLVAVASTHDWQVNNGYVMSPELHTSAVTLWSVATPSAPRALVVLGQRGGYGTDFTKPRSRRQRRKDPATLLSGHAAPARTLSFSPGGLHLATGGDDGTVLVWDIRDPARPRHLRTLTHTDGVHRMVYGPDQTMVTCCAPPSPVSLWRATD